MNGLAWLNDLMVWFGQWVPRLTLIRVTHLGVRFNRSGRPQLIMPGLCLYWPIAQQLEIVSVCLRTSVICAQLHGREALSLVIAYRVIDPVLMLLTYSDLHANLDQRAQAALSATYRAEQCSHELGGALLARMRAEFDPAGVLIEDVRVAQRGPVLSIKKLSDWSQHEEQTGK